MALTGAAGCGGGVGDRFAPKSKASESGPRPAITVQQAGAVVDRYEKVNNQANKTRDSRLLSTVEGGALLASSQAGYEQFSALPAKKRKSYGSPFFYIDRHFYIPVGTTWFAVEATVKGEASEKNFRRFLVFDRGAENGAWKNVAGVSAEGKIPKVTLDDDGYATAVSPDRKVGVLAPNDLAGSVNDLVVTGGTGKSKQTLVSTPTAQRARAVHRNRNKNLSARVVFTPVRPEHSTVYALKTELGVLAVFNGAYDKEMTSTTHYIKPSKDTAIYMGRKQRTHFNLHYLYQGLAHLPATGKASLIGRNADFIGAEG
ncbi:hypothetical protein [Actinomadura sp. 3N407]|uniref:hypothetical protein n=1 Tax=Actinomadura sp. 3N407 TaxID=3457423 RepID=UPI003FCEDC50